MDICFYFQEAKGLLGHISLRSPDGQRRDELEQQLLDHYLDGLAQGCNSIGIFDHGQFLGPSFELAVKILMKTQVLLFKSHFEINLSVNS